MPALATSPASEPPIAALADGAHARAESPGRSLTLLDARPPSRFTRREEDEALEQLANVAGPATAGITRRVAESFDSIRAELNERAGGQASAHVMTLAHNAQRAQLAVELQTTVSVAAHGKYVANDGDKGQAEKGLSRLVGICAFATDLLTKAFAAAAAEAKAAGSPTEQLMARLGHGTEVPAPSPFGPPGGSSFGSLPIVPSPIPPNPEEPK
jgi:cation transport regulator ChaC